MALKRMVRIKDVPKETNGLISTYMARKLYLEGKIPGTRLLNSIILIDIEGLERVLEQEAAANIRDEQEELHYGIRKVY